MMTTDHQCAASEWSEVSHHDRSEFIMGIPNTTCRKTISVNWNQLCDKASSGQVADADRLNCRSWCNRGKSRLFVRAFPQKKSRCKWCKK